MDFKIVVSDPSSRKAYKIEKEQNVTGLVGKKIGDRFAGDSLGLNQYELEITGGSDKQGFPMRRDVEGAARKKILLNTPPGFHPEKKGQRKRKSIRGNTISSDIVQVNAKVVKKGPKNPEELLGIKKAKKPEKKGHEGGKEAPKEEKGKETKEKESKGKPAESEGRQKETAKEEKPKQEKKGPEEAEKKMGIKKLEDDEASEKKG